MEWSVEVTPVIQETHAQNADITSHTSWGKKKKKKEHHAQLDSCINSRHSTSKHLSPIEFFAFSLPIKRDLTNFIILFGKHRFCQPYVAICRLELWFHKLNQESTVKSLRLVDELQSVITADNLEWTANCNHYWQPRIHHVVKTIPITVGSLLSKLLWTIVNAWKAVLITVMVMARTKFL